MSKNTKNLFCSECLLLNVENDSKKADFLDKLAQLRNFEKTTIDKLRKRAFAKACNYTVLGGLLKLKSPKRKHYLNAAFCVHHVFRNEGRLTSNYCNSRACLVCNRIRTGKLINAYLDPLSKLKDLRFVTLTKPTVRRGDLKDTLNDMLKVCRRITDRLRKRGIKINGIRKLEITYNHSRHWYHAHFHFLLEGKEVGDILMEEWLKEYPKALKFLQDNRKASIGTCKELFKYVCKPPIKDDGKVSYIALDVMIRALFRRRTIQPLGSIKKLVNVSEDVTAEDAILFSKDLRNVTYTWEQEYTDWVDKLTGEVLSGYKPTNEDRERINGCFK